MHGFKGENGSCDNLWWKFSSLVLAGFFGLLRPGERFRLQKQDVGLPNSLSLGSLFASVRVRQPRMLDRWEGISLQSFVTWMPLTGFLGALAVAISRIVFCGQAPLRSFAKCSSNFVRSLRFKISHCKFTPASLRAGGATWEIDRDSCNIAHLRFEGRWANLRSLEHYIQVARAQQLLLSIPEETSQRLRKWIGDHFFLLTLPPFLGQEVPSRSLLESTPTLDCKPSDVVAACRKWGNHQGSSKAV